MSKSLFNLFEEVSAKAWKQKIQSDLKGADYNETLIWKSLEGIDVKPFYHSEDFKNFRYEKIEGEGADTTNVFTEGITLKTCVEGSRASIMLNLEICKVC